MKEPEINDPSLLRCTVKKSIQVIKKLSLYVAALAVMAIIGYGIYLGLPTLTKIAGMVVDVLVSIVTVLVSIPWYYYVGAVVIAAIPTYSFIWCVARNLTDEDWNSDTAKNVAVAVDTKTLLFIGAYLHYWKRMKNLKIKRGENDEIH
jgi:hypothetical protein